MATTKPEQNHKAPSTTCGGNVTDLDIPGSGCDTAPDMLRRARDRYIERRKIDRVFGLDGFTVSFCWDLMLRFYDVEASGQMLCVPLMGDHESCPPTTCMRWLKVLVDMDLIEQTSAPQGTEEVLYRLTPSGRAATEKALLIGP